jgi:hypothetical protein
VKRKKLWLITVVLAVTGALAPLSVLKPVDPETRADAVNKWRSANEIVRSLQECAQSSMEQYEQLQAISQCYNEEFALAAGTGTLDRLFATVKKMEQQDAGILAACHIGAHRAGYQLGSRQDPVRTLRQAVTDIDVCDQGYVHGVLEGIGLQQVTPETFRELSSICVNAADSIVRLDCIDGFGHSGWVRYKEPGLSVAVCMMFQVTEEQAHCIRGIMMAMNNPDLNDGKRVLDPQDRDQICQEVARVPTVGVVHIRSCYNGVVLSLLNETVNETQLVTIEGAGNISKQSRQRLTELWRAPLSECENWGEYASTCHRAVLQQLYVHLPEERGICQTLSDRSPLRRKDDCIGPLPSVE